MPSDQIVPDNIKSVAAIYAAAQLEQMRLFDVVDRIVQQFVSGQLPVGAGSAGRALAAYHWSGTERIAALERRALYTRVLGMPGGDAQPNSEFEDLWQRFVAAVAEFSRQQSDAALREAAEAAGRNLAVNVSIRGGGYVWFAARKLNKNIASALAILKQPEIQRAYGVADAYRVIEQVSALELGGARNIVRFRTRADAGSRILQSLARGRLFRSPRDRDALIQSVDQWVSVGEVPDEPVNSLSAAKRVRRVPRKRPSAG